MNKKLNILKYILLFFSTIFMYACSSSKQTMISDASLYIEGFDYGPSVSKILVKLNSEVNDVEFSKDTTVITAGVSRVITDVYLSDDKGNQLSNAEKSQFLILDLKVDYSFSNPDINASPMMYNETTMRAQWVAEYPLDIKHLEVIETNGTKKVLAFQGDVIKNRVIPENDNFSVRDITKGNYVNPLTGKNEEITLRYAAYEPESIKGSEKNPLIIWLHGGGEGGTDLDIVLLGAEVAALTRNEIQSHFTSTGNGNQTGAYVLAVQTETLWMDDGSGDFSPSATSSRNTKALMDTIKQYVASNPDIDENRIYVSGCSNGGYMSVELGVQYPDYFAALVPIATPYPYYPSYQQDKNGKFVKSTIESTSEVVFTNDKIEKLKDQAIWFIHSENDNIISAQDYAMPVYKALVDNGASNSWFSFYKTVKGADAPNESYLGHFSWVYYFNNQVNGVQDVSEVLNNTGISGFEASDLTNGGTSVVEVDKERYTNIFEWMNAQSID